MQKINLIDFYRMGHSLGHLRLLKAGKPTEETFDCLVRARGWLTVICKHPANIIELEITRPAAQTLLDLVSTVSSRIMVGEIGSELRHEEVGKIWAALNRFEFILLEETSGLATYYVSKKRNYSTMALIERAENEFPESVRKRLSHQAITDIKSAGKCIAFELGTACGIHSYRALEAVALDYLIRRELSAPQRDLWTYLDMLERDGANTNAIQVCQQLRKLRRNPLAHPEDNLDVDQAIEAFQLCTTAIIALVRDMEKRGLFANS